MGAGLGAMGTGKSIALLATADVLHALLIFISVLISSSSSTGTLSLSLILSANERDVAKISAQMYTLFDNTEGVSLGCSLTTTEMWSVTSKPLSFLMFCTLFTNSR